MPLSYLLILFILSYGIIAASVDDRDGNMTLIPALAANYRTPISGQAWRYKGGRFDLESRAEYCQCFEPESESTHPDPMPILFTESGTETCCLSSIDKTNFCINKTASCCQGTFCPNKETCCGRGGCCPGVCEKRR